MIINGRRRRYRKKNTNRNNKKQEKDNKKYKWNSIEMKINRKKILQERKTKKGGKEGNDQKRKEKMNKRKK
jgi:hypothetical protein